jgi:DNA-binding transcriptional ArsR family regulator
MDAVAHATNHPIRRRLIEAMWHSAEPLSPLRFHSEYLDPNKVTLDQVTYHVRQLEKDKIIRVEGSGPAERYERSCFVLDDENSSEAVRRLELTT